MGQPARPAGHHLVTLGTKAYLRSSLRLNLTSEVTQWPHLVLDILEGLDPDRWRLRGSVSKNQMVRHRVANDNDHRPGRSVDFKVVVEFEIVVGRVRYQQEDSRWYERIYHLK